MRRREFISILGTCGLWPLAAQAQPSERMRRIGVLMGNPEGDPRAQVNVAALRQGLQSLGWSEGRNVAIEYRLAGGDRLGREP
jgi:putative ABC transport system substrate-binding protein